MSKRTVLYARVSTDEQANNYSLPTQLEACRKYAECSGLEVVGEFSDDFSGATPIEARPEGRKAFAMLKSSEADCLIAYSMDRLARPPEDSDEWDVPILIRGLAKLGKELHTVDRGRLNTDFASLLVATLDAKSAGDERRKIIERTGRGRKAKAQSGKVVGNGCAPFGFAYCRIEGKTIGLVINEEEAKIVQDIYRWYTQDGLSGYAIARRLSEQGIATSGERRGLTSRRTRGANVWCGHIIYDILDNELYIGTWYYGADKIAVPVPAIIGPAPWQATRKRREEGNHSSQRKNLYLLTGRILCGCGLHMVGGPCNVVLYYRCSSYHHRLASIEGRGCSEGGVRAEVLEKAAWDFALQAKKSAAEFLAMLKEYQERQQTELAPLAEQIAEVKAMIDRASHKIKRLASLRGSATDDDEAAQYIADLETAKADKASLERKSAKLEGKYRWQDTITDEDILTVLEIRERDLKQLQGATFEEKRRYLAKIDLQVTIQNGIAHFKCRKGVSKDDRAEMPVSGRLIASLHPQSDS